MLFVNNEHLNLNLSLDETPPKHKNFIREFETFKQEIRDFKFPVVFKVKRSDTRKQNSYKGHYEPTPADRISLKATHQSSTGNEEWVYQKTFPRLKPNGQPTWKEPFEWVRGSMLIHENQLDKLFFIMKKSPYLKTKLIYHHDPALIARNKVKAAELKNEVEFLILNPKSEISGNYEFLKTIAKSFGVPKVEGKAIDEVKLSLLTKVLSGDDIKTKGAQAFIKACNMDEGIKNKAKIQDAADKGIIKWTPNRKQVTFLGEKGDPSKVVYTVTGRAEFWLDEFSNYLKGDTPLLKKILAGVEGGKIHDFSVEDVDEMMGDWEKVKEICGDIGIKSVGRKKEDIADDLRAYALS